MKIDDSDLKKAFQKQEVPAPDQDRKEQVVRDALHVFRKKKTSEEKKSKGFLSLVRLMGNFVKHLTSIKGEPIMTNARFATIGVAVIALGVALSTPMFLGQRKHVDTESIVLSKPVKEEVKKDLDRKVLPADPEPLHVEQEVDETGHDASALQESQDAFGQAPVKTKLAREGESLATQSFAVPSSAAPELSAGKSVSMEVRGRILADQDASHFSYKDIGRDKFEKVTPNPVKLATEEPVSTFSIDVDTASYTFVRRQLNRGVLPQKNAVRIEELINYFDYDYAVPEDRVNPFEPSVAVYPTPWNKNTKLMHIGIKGYDLVTSEKPPANLVFLLDVSGSMNSPDKLPLLKNSFALLVEQLLPEDTVSIVVYAGAAGTVLEPTQGKEKGKILAALDRLEAGGSTAGGEGIRLAYSLAEANFRKDAVNRVILATDGDFNVGITDQEELKSFIERKRETGVFLSVFGFGQGNYNDALMQTLAQNGNGNAAYIDNLNEARKVLVDEASSTLFTIAKDVKIQVEFNPALVNDYRLIGYETRLLNREDFNNDRVDAGDVGSGHTVTAIYEITPVESSEKLIDGLRYQDAGKNSAGKSTEYAFLKIRYKQPDADKSQLITKPIDSSLEYAEFANVPLEMQFAAAVAGFGQLLRNDPYTHDFGYDDVIKIGQAARGKDEFGYRTEFLNLARLAKSSRAM